MKKIIILMNICVIMLSVDIFSAGSNNTDKKPVKITLNRADGSVFEKMEGSSKWVENVPALNKNQIIEANKVAFHQKVVLNKANGTKVYSYDFKKWYSGDGESDGNLETESKELNKLNDFKIFPNPATNQTEVSFVANESGNVKVSLYFLDGSKLSEIYNGNVNNGLFQVLINTSKYYAGTYLCQIEYNGLIFNDKLIIKN